MNTLNKNLLLIPVMLVFLAVLVSASSVTTSLFYDSTTSNSLQIMNGQNVGATVSADSILEPSMHVKVDLLDSSGSFLVNMLDVYSDSNSYSNHFLFGNGTYVSPGNYIISSTVTGASGQTATARLYLVVLPVIPPNQVPVITSAPVTSVNASQPYYYQVVATDADGDPLTYSLTQNPSWIFMNSTGFVSGIAPNVTADYQYVVTVQVSDSKSFVTQTFPITVKHTGVVIPPDTTPPVITVVSPINNRVVNKSNVLFNITTNKPVSDATVYFCLTRDPVTGLCGGIWGSSFPLTKDSPTSFSRMINLTDGTYVIYFDAKDLAGNLGQTSQILFKVNTSTIIPPNTTPPVITVVSPVSNRIYNTSSIPFQITTDKNASLAWFNLTASGNSVSFQMTEISPTLFSTNMSLAGGNYSVVFYAQDLAGNIGNSSQISFSVNKTIIPPDTTPPVVNIISPVNGNNYSAQVTSINYTAIDNDLATCWYSLDNGVTNVTVTCNTLITNISSVNGTNTWTVYAKDLAGNVGSKSVTFTVNASNPHVPQPQPIGGIGRRSSGPAAQNLAFENQQYQNQFAPKTAAEAAVPVAQGTGISALGIILIILGILLVGIIIWIFLLLVG